MKKALPWIIGFLALLVLCACIEVGWLYSILTIGIVCVVLFAVHTLHKKALQTDANEHDKQLANGLRKIVVGVSVCLVLIGIILGGVGLLTPETDGYNLQKCGYCGGTGRLTSGKICGLCDGAGGGAYENHEYANSTWLGILMAAAGAVLFVGMSMLKESVDNKELDTAESTISIHTPTATFAIAFGHEVPGMIRNTWVSQKPDDSGAWTVRCHVKYSGNKPARKLVLYTTPYTTANIKVKEQEILLFEGDFTEGFDNIITW